MHPKACERNCLHTIQTLYKFRGKTSFRIESPQLGHVALKFNDDACPIKRLANCEMSSRYLINYLTVCTTKYTDRTIYCSATNTINKKNSICCRRD